MIDLKINGKMLDNISLIIFDKDGTLFELYPFWSEVAKIRSQLIYSKMNVNDPSMIDLLVHTMGIDTLNQKISPKGPIGILHRKDIQDILYREILSKGYAINRADIELSFKEADEHFKTDTQLKEHLIPVKGMLDFIKSLNNKCKCALFSNDMTGRLEKITELFEIHKNFDLFVGGDVTQNPKPHPEGAIKIMKILNADPNNTIFIGDSLADIECGMNAKCKYLVAVKSDISDINSLNKHNCEIVDDFTQIQSC